MASLVTLEEVRDHLMVDSVAVNPWINMMIPAISQAVLSWLKDDWRAYETMLDSNGEPLEDSAGEPIILEDSSGSIVKPMVKAATLIELASQFRFRDGDGVAHVPSNWGHGHVLCMGATALLVALRRPTAR